MYGEQEWICRLYMLWALHSMAHSAKPSITAVQQQRGQMVGVTQKVHRGISLPQMPLERYGWPKLMEPEDLTNSILVFLLSVFIATLRFYIAVLPFHKTDVSAICNSTLLLLLNGGLACGNLTIRSVASYSLCKKPTPLLLPLLAKRCAWEHCCFTDTHLSMPACSNTLPGLFVSVFGSNFIPNSWHEMTTAFSKCKSYHHCALRL